jgi:hypothetical protein
MAIFYARLRAKRVILDSQHTNYSLRATGQSATHEYWRRAYTPTIAAAILRYRETGALGVRKLSSHTFDYNWIPNIRWIDTAVVMFPLLYYMTYVAMRTMGYLVPAVWSPSLSLIGVFLLFFAEGSLWLPPLKN